MIKKFVIISLTLVVTLTINAQKKDGFYCGNFNYELPPQNTALNKYKGYTVTFKFPYSGISLTKYKSARKRFSLSGFEQYQTINNNGFLVLFNFLDPIYELEKVTKLKTYKEIDGEKQAVYLYQYSADYNYDYTVKVTSIKGEIFFQNQITVNGSIKGKEKSTKTAALTSFIDKKQNVSLKNAYHKDIQKQASIIENKFCYLPKYLSLKMYKIKNKKYNYDKYNSYIDSVKSIVSTANWHAFIEDTDRILLLEMLNYYNEQLKTGEPDKKKARFNSNVMSLTFYNMGLVYFILEDYPQSLYHLKQSIEYDKKFFGNISHHKHVAIQLFYDRQDSMRELD